MPHFAVSKVSGLLLLLGLLLVPTQAQAQESAPSKGDTKPPSAVSAAAQNPSPATYVGSESCKTCHADIYNGWEKSPHWKLTFKEGGIAKHGCEDCHGAAASHVADPTDTSKLFLFEKATPKEIDSRCLGCHAGGTQHMNAINSEHAKNEVSCVSCHSPHHGKDSDFMLVKSQPELCYSCHLAKKAEFDMPFHHRVNEGLVQCTDCHNPHGAFAPTWRMSQRPRMVEQALTNEEPCVKCHADKRGPFAYEHPPVRVEGCETCHYPHGSTNTRLLRRPVVFTLCLQCHNGAGDFGTRNNGIPVLSPSHNLLDPRYQQCTTCHVRIHGSNSDAFFMR